MKPTRPRLLPVLTVLGCQLLAVSLSAADGSKPEVSRPSTPTRPATPPVAVKPGAPEKPTRPTDALELQRQLMDDFQKARETYLAQQKQLQESMRSKSNDERTRLVEELKEKRTAWIEEQKTYRERMKELRDSLKDLRDKVKEEAGTDSGRRPGR